jgi:hypothetical protein
MSVQPDSPSGVEDVDATSVGPRPADVALPCIYCHADIASSEFVFWSVTQRLLSAVCPQCGRRVTLLASTWRRWSREPEPRGG